jgi:hypothetical protein
MDASALCSNSWREQLPRSTHGFTRIELVVIVACFFLVVLVTFPLLGDSRAGSHEAVCMNNLKRWGAAFFMFAEEHNDSVPEEGISIYAIWNNADAWYNVCPIYFGEKGLDPRYYANPPQPVSPLKRDVFSCPSARVPDPSYNIRNQTYFMYGENARLCINRSTRLSTGVPQTRFSGVIKPADTICVGEVNGKISATDTLSNAGFSQSNVTGQYSIGRHGGRDPFYGTGLFCMCDGGVCAATYQDFWRDGSVSNSSSLEWGTYPNYITRKIYWYPTPTTPN